MKRLISSGVSLMLTGPVWGSVKALNYSVAGYPRVAGYYSVAGYLGVAEYPYVAGCPAPT